MCIYILVRKIDVFPSEIMIHSYGFFSLLLQFNKIHFQVETIVSQNNMLSILSYKAFIV